MTTRVNVHTHITEQPYGKTVSSETAAPKRVTIAYLSLSSPDLSFTDEINCYNNKVCLKHIDRQFFSLSIKRYTHF